MTDDLLKGTATRLSEMVVSNGYCYNCYRPVTETTTDGRREWECPKCGVLMSQIKELA